jgi:SOS-response transcriptional repressor LexA
MQGASPAPPRREEALAYIVERIVRSGTSPSYAEIGKAMRPRVGITRVRDLVNELIVLEVIDRDPGSQRGIRIRDVARCRKMIERALGFGGWWHAPPLGTLTPPDSADATELPLMPAFEHLPDPD